MLIMYKPTETLQIQIHTYIPSKSLHMLFIIPLGDILIDGKKYSLSIV